LQEKRTSKSKNRRRKKRNGQQGRKEKKNEYIEVLHFKIIKLSEKS